MAMTSQSHVLEINLISAQGLTGSSVMNHRNHRRMKTYAIAWVDPSTKLRTRVDRVGGENPTWNDKFIFKVSPRFLSGKISAVSVEIYAVGIFRDKLIGSVRILICNFLPTASSAAMEAPAFAAFLIRSPSGEFFGTLNVGVMVLDEFNGFQALSKVSAIDYHDLTGENLDGKHHTIRANKSKSKVSDVMDYIPSDSLTWSSSSSHRLTESRDLSLKESAGNDPGAETPLNEEITSVNNMEQPLGTDLQVGEEITEEVISDSGNEGAMFELEKDVEMIMEENKKLKELVDMLRVETEGQSSVVSDLSGRVKNLERKLARRNKRRKPHYGRIIAPKPSDAIQAKSSV